MIVRTRHSLTLWVLSSTRPIHSPCFLKDIHDVLLSTSRKQFTMASIAADPKAGQEVEHGGKTYTTVREGKAYILVPPNAQTLVDPQAKPKAGEHIF